MPSILRRALPLIILAELPGTAPQTGFIAGTLLIALWPLARDGQ